MIVYDIRCIEDNIRKMCSDLVHDAVVIGLNRPLPCLLVESFSDDLDANTCHKLATEIVSRTSPFNERLFRYEHIDDPKRILVLEKGTLPRTKVRTCVCVTLILAKI